jgi:general nucleoside transport system permease protein
VSAVWKDRLARGGLNIGAALLGLAVAALLISLILLLRGNDPIESLKVMVDYASQPTSTAGIINQAIPYYIAAIAVAIGFRMNIFNIGIDGQYRLAVMVAAIVAGNVALPNGLSQIVTIVVAMLVGGLWASIAAILKVTRGVSEVISTIMLNFIATAVVAYLLRPDKFGIQKGNDIATKEIPGSGQIVGLAFPGTDRKIYGLIILAVIVGVLYQVVISRTRFGFDLRATGRSESAAAASGVKVKRMVLITMIGSGAIAGLVGLPNLLGESHAYTLNFPAGIGFTGIAIALLGRNNPIAIVFASLLWAFLDQSNIVLDLYDVPKEITQILQGVVVLSVVITYEVVRRFATRLQQSRVGRELAAPPPPTPPPAASSPAPPSSAPKTLEGPA